MSNEVMLAIITAISAFLTGWLAINQIRAKTSLEAVKAQREEDKNAHNKEIEALKVRQIEITAQAAQESQLTTLLGKSLEYQQQTAKASRQTASKFGEMVQAVNNMSVRMEDWDDRTRLQMETVLRSFESIETGMLVIYSFQEDAAGNLKTLLEVLEEVRGIPAKTQEGVAQIVADALRQIQTLLVNNLAIKPVVIGVLEPDEEEKENS